MKVNWIGVKRKITLKVVAGPGIFPTGKTFVLDPDSENKSMLDGKGAIEFRSYYAGITRIVAESEGLKSAADHPEDHGRLHRRKRGGYFHTVSVPS